MITREEFNSKGAAWKAVFMLDALEKGIVIEPFEPNQEVTTEDVDVEVIQSQDNND